jgi:acetyl-CoA carboxylase biotin carboxyl carrier protein|tara:strand:+ start:603 stop:1016 length:414 start_codon:yes stop_codon:yes gene_type:complete
MKINKKLIEELTSYLDEFGLSEIEYGNNDIKIKVSKKTSSEKLINNNQQKINKTENEKDSSKKIISPIIGTAYLAPEPGAKKFVEKGKKIKKGDTVLIVEAMKTMNHVPSIIDGEVEEVCVEDGQPVEFGQTLVILK